METYIQISYLNDFIFCPRSIYFHQLYGNIATVLYHEEAQIKGRAVHEAIDQRTYSTEKDVLQGIDVYSQEYGICGKIDLLDTNSKTLTERKKHIETIYDGYIFQLYAQYFALLEMGYEVDQLYLYSVDTNKKFEVSLPQDDRTMYEKFNRLITEINNFDLNNFNQTNEDKCKRCVYSELCDQSLC